MTNASKLTFPLVNANEPEAFIAALHVSEGQEVKAGEMLYTLETTKSTVDVEAEGEGFIVGIQVAVGDTVRAGEIFAYLASSPDWTPPVSETPAPAEHDETPDGLRITQPALALAQENELDLTKLALGPLVTESQIKALLNEAVGEVAPVPLETETTELIVYGGGGHGKSVIDLVRAQGKYHVVAVMDDGISAGAEILGVPVVGGSEILGEMYNNGVRLAANAVGGIGNIGSRVAVYSKLAQAGFACPTLVHPTAFVEPSASLSLGVQVFPQAYVGSDTEIGFGSIINTGAIVSHDCRLADMVNISPGAILAGAVVVGKMALVGMGVTVNLNVHIGERAQIGNSATVKADVPAGGIVRAGSVWPK